MYQNIFFERNRYLIHLWDDTLGYRTFPYKKYAYIKDPNGEYESMYGDRLTKVHKWEKDSGEELFESDVPETTRVLVDLYNDDTPSKGHIVLTFDIEVEMNSGLPNIEKAENEITSIAAHDDVTKEYHVFVVDKNNKVKGKSFQKDGRDVHIHIYQSERELLNAYITYIESVNATIWTGWNIDFFDVPYLYNRIKNVAGENQANRLSSIGKTYWSPYRNRYSIAGVSTMDYIGLYKRYNFGLESSYTLNHIATKELGRGKLEYEGSLDDLFENDLEKFIEYNITDVELIVSMDAKLQFIELSRAICHSGFTPYEDYIFSSKYLEGACLAYLKTKGLVAPNKPKNHKDKLAEQSEAGEDKFIGAYVKEPIVVKYDWGQRKFGKSSANPLVLIDIAINGLISTSKLPARIGLISGFLVSFVSMLVGIYVYCSWAFFDFEIAPGLTTIAIAVFFLSGIQLSFMGLIGEYVLSIHGQVRPEPKVFDKLLINFGDEND